MGNQTPPPDPRALRAIAHPTRRRILVQLGASGPLRAADIAHELDIPANQASFHLRQLAKYGFVHEDPEAARDRRDRVWRLPSDDGIRLRLEDYGSSTEGEAAVHALRGDMVEWGRFLVGQALRDAESPDEGAKRMVSEDALRLTDDERQQFLQEWEAFYKGWVDRTRGTDDGRELYSLYLVFQPYPDVGERA